MKFHGIYAQDNRDTRRQRAITKETLDYIYMTRVVVPGGAQSSEQWLALDSLAGEVADGTLRLTTQGASPALARASRDRVAAVMPDGVAHAAMVLRAERQELHDAGASSEGFDWRRRVRQLLGQGTS